MIVSRQSSVVSRQRIISAAIKASLTAVSFVAVTALAALPAKAFAQAASEAQASGVHTPQVQQHTREGTDLVPINPVGGVGGGSPSGPGGGGSGGGSGPVVTYYNRSTTAHTARVQLSNGVEVTVDAAANRVTVTHAGQTKSFTLDEVLLKATKGNAALASARGASLRAELSNPIGNARFRRLNGTTADSQFLGSGGAGLPPHSTYAPHGSIASPDLMKAPGGGGYPMFDCSFYYACRYQEINYDFWGSGGYGFWFYDTNNLSGGGSQHTDDWYAWNRWREDRCADAKEDAVAATLESTTMVGGLFGGPPGWIVSAVSGVALIIQMNYGADNSRACLSKYPGYRQWG